MTFSSCGLPFMGAWWLSRMANRCSEEQKYRYEWSIKRACLELARSIRVENKDGRRAEGVLS